jgi:hypothetical protein
MFVRWLIFIHVVAVFTFYLAHGASAAMAFRLRKETDLARIRALLDLSSGTSGIMAVSFVLMGLTGILLPFLIQIWGRIWVWLSIVLMLFVAAWMSWFNENAYKPLRRMAGLPYMIGGKSFPAEPPVAPEAINEHIRKISLMGLIAIGYAIPLFVLWLMVFKPF